MAEKNRLLSWLKLWHPPKKSSTTGDAVEGSSDSQHKLHRGTAERARWGLMKYGRRGWIRHWNLLHLDQRSCAQSKDVCTECPQQSRENRYLPALPKEASLDHATQGKLRNFFMDLRDRGKETSNVKVNMGAKDVFKRAGASMDADIAAVDMQSHKSALKNRVLPVTGQEDVHFSTATLMLRTSTLFRVDEEYPVSAFSERMEPETPKHWTSSLPFKNIFPRVSSTPVSPRSPWDIKWRMPLSSSSQAGSPRDLSQVQWSIPFADMSHQKGSSSTMGSPWHSQSGGFELHNHTAASFNCSYKQGQWITTDSHFVVLEL